MNLDCKIKIETYKRITLIYPDTYPDNLTNTRNWLRKKYNLKTIRIENLLGGNKVIFMGKYDSQRRLF